MYGGRASSAFNDRSGASRDAQGHTVSFHPTARLRIENVHYEIQAFQLEVRPSFLRQHLTRATC